MTFAPTAEQVAIRDAFLTGGPLVIEAGAGTGKTSTLELLASSVPKQRGLYLAYNKAIQLKANGSFPDNVGCKTAHSLAYAEHGKRFKRRLNARRITNTEAARILRLTDTLTLGEVKIGPKGQARLVNDTLKRFCYSADDTIGTHHVPPVEGLDRIGNRAVAAVIAPIAQRAWDNDICQEDGQLKFEFDYYLKMWILDKPVLPVDFLLFDEAQDANPALAALVASQTHLQQVLVGDRCQSIYGWRGATDAMQHAAGNRLYLTQSFRFGPAIAEYANLFLERLDTPLRLTGYDKIDSAVGELTRPKAMLCRTNAGVIGRALTALTGGRRVGIVGGGREIERFARAAGDLMQGRPTEHPDLSVFNSWGEVQEYVEQDEAGADIRAMVRIVDRYDTDTIISMCAKLVDVDKGRPDLVISTAHKAKGCEWDTVRCATDFPAPKVDPETGLVDEPTREDIMLAYVAVTRAMTHLDPGGLSWIAGGAVQPVSAPPSDPTVNHRPAPVTVTAPKGVPSAPPPARRLLAEPTARPFSAAAGVLVKATVDRLGMTVSDDLGAEIARLVDAAAEDITRQVLAARGITT
jgi:hypothetical protein